MTHSLVSTFGEKVQDDEMHMVRTLRCILVHYQIVDGRGDDRPGSNTALVRLRSITLVC